MEKITLIIPCYNEQEVLGILYEELKKVTSQMNQHSFELLFVDDGSKDDTLKILKEIDRKSVV